MVMQLLKSNHYPFSDKVPINYVCLASKRLMQAILSAHRYEGLSFDRDGDAVSARKVNTNIRLYQLS